MIRLVTLLTIFLMSCATKKDKPIGEKTKHHYYEDINIYKLEGINEQKEISFPCIEIQDSGEHKIVTFHIAKDWAN